MSSFNRPPRPFGFPGFHEAAQFAPPSTPAGRPRATPSFAEFAPAFDAPAEPLAQAAASTPTHSWLDLDLIPSWLRPFTLDANTRFTRTPDHFLRPREPEAETAPAPEIPTRGWHFLLDASDDEPAADEPLAPEIHPVPDEVEPAPAAEAFAVASEVEEATTAGLAAPEPMEAPPASGAVEGAGIGDQVATTEDVTQVQQDVDAATDSLSPIAIAAVAATALEPAAGRIVTEQADEAPPAHLEALARLVVLGRAALPPLPAVEQDLVPSQDEDALGTWSDGVAAQEVARAMDGEREVDADTDDGEAELVGDAAVGVLAAPVAGDEAHDEDAAEEDDAAVDHGLGDEADDLAAQAEDGDELAAADDVEEDEFEEDELEESACGADEDAGEIEEEAFEDEEDDAFEDDADEAEGDEVEDEEIEDDLDDADDEEVEDEPEEALLVASADDAAADDTDEEEDGADDEDAEDEDLLLAGNADGEEAGEDDTGANDALPAASPTLGLPILTVPGPALWRPYQQSISAHFLGAVAPPDLVPAAAASTTAVASALAAVAPPVADAVVPAVPTAAEGDVEDAGAYDLPPLDLLREPPLVEPDYELSEEFLDQSSSMLQQVLRDFGVRGEVIDANPGPVVTLYEFEPAPGVKSSRVIGLSPDIARSMSAISARVAVVEGRNVIGIELPNRRRETVWLRELLASHEFTEARPKLGLCLGKTIGGAPVIADLARMPHLLVAGTTGSGKSVAINTMILSLLYRHTPDACRLIMIDPKMLELSIYEGIPHLLTPVVTDPKKAIIALKWAVKEMEERYKKMSRLAVRNIDGFNARVKEASEKGEVITRNVQVGFDKETGESLFEEQEMDLTPLPYIVVIVDEMADLMMVAGKEIEGAIQRLAQMARAAGIHLVMATQRPSVDVITGTIKANFPTRISFQVTSKIDSRTILGEMGAETLLGQGDMLFMAGGGRITRVHGPFVSDSEVEHVVAFLKAQGGPDYLDAVVLDEDAEAEEEDEAVFDRSGLAEAGGDLYEQAIAIVMRDRKASTSYIQRRLQVGYNKAASLMERMENEGIVGPANHAGKREILTFTRPG